MYNAQRPTQLKITNYTLRKKRQRTVSAIRCLCNLSLMSKQEGDYSQLPALLFGASTLPTFRPA